MTVSVHRWQGNHVPIFIIDLLIFILDDLWFCSLSEFLPWDLRLATVVASVRLNEEGSGDRVTHRVSVGQQSNLRLWGGAF
jgi:hypothetical protein